MTLSLAHDRLETMRRTDGIIWIAAVVISLLIHGTLFINRTTELSIAMEKRESEKSITRISFRTPVPPPVKPVEVKPEPPKPQPVVEKPRPKPKPKPKPKPRPKPKPKPIPKPVEKVTPPEEIKQAPARAVPAARAPVAKTLPILRPVVDPRLVEQARQSYLAKLLAHIESHKHYPRSARRRRIEGEIQVSFRLLAGGRIDGLKVVGKRSVLQKATRSAVIASLPMPKPPKELGLPLSINFTMVFVLK